MYQSFSHYLRVQPLFQKVFIYRKRSLLREKISLWYKFLGKFAAIVDFKNTAYPYLCFPKERTSFIRKKLHNQHKKDYYINILKKLAKKTARNVKVFPEIDGRKKEYFQSILGGNKYIFVSLFSRSNLKSYSWHKFREVIEELKEAYNFVLIGSEEFKVGIPGFIQNFTGKTNIEDLFYLFNNYARAVVAVDSAPLHIASYINVPVVALFGPTSPQLYGPFSRKRIVLTNSLACVPCQSSFCKIGENKCLTQLKPSLITNAIKDICS